MTYLVAEQIIQVVQVWMYFPYTSAPQDGLKTRKWQADFWNYGKI